MLNKQIKIKGNIDKEKREREKEKVWANTIWFTCNIGLQMYVRLYEFIEHIIGYHLTVSVGYYPRVLGNRERKMKEERERERFMIVASYRNDDHHHHYGHHHLHNHPYSFLSSFHSLHIFCPPFVQSNIIGKINKKTARNEQNYFYFYLHRYIQTID